MQRERGKRIMHFLAVMVVIIIVSLGASLAYSSQKKKVKASSGIIAQVAKARGVEQALVMAIIRTESNFNPIALNPSSAPGVAISSYGLMQITTALAYDYGLITNWRSPSSYEIGKLYDPINNLNVGCWFLSKLSSKYPLDTVIQMYNVGEAGYKKGRRNQNYLKKVRQHYEYYKT